MPFCLLLIQRVKGKKREEERIDRWAAFTSQNLSVVGHSVVCVGMMASFLGYYYF